MTNERSQPHWLNKFGMFLVTCFVSAALMRLLVRDNAVLFNLPMGLALLVVAVRGAWGCLRWRYASPLRFAALLGLCSGVGGAGLFMVAAHGLLSAPTRPSFP